jgi:hypothetical protein
LLFGECFNFFKDEPYLARTVTYTRELRRPGAAVEHGFSGAADNLSDSFGINAGLLSY